MNVRGDAQVVSISHRTKSVQSLLGKLSTKAKEGRDYSIGDSTDLLGGRIVTDNLASLEKVMGRVEELYGSQGRILEKENKYVKNQGTDNPYRAVHYIIKISDNEVFELQLKTESSMVASDLYHNGVYKPEILNLDPSKKDAILGYTLKSNHTEVVDYLSKLH